MEEVLRQMKAAVQRVRKEFMERHAVDTNSNPDAEVARKKPDEAAAGALNN